MKRRKITSMGLAVLLATSVALPSVFAEEEYEPSNDEELEYINEEVESDKSDETENSESGEIQFSLKNTDYLKKNFNVTITFPKDVDFDLLSTDNIHVRNLELGDDESADVSIRLKKDEDNRTVTLTLKEDLDQDTRYQIIIEGVYDVNGNMVDDKRKSFISSEQQEEKEITELSEVTELKGTAISASSLKFTWKYDKNEEKKIDGFYVYDEDGDLLTEDNDINAKDREYILKGLKPSKNYTITVRAFKLLDDEEVLESEGVSSGAKTKNLKMPAFSESNLVATVKGYNIQYYWSYKNYQDYEENFTDYEIQIADDAKFTKNVKKISLAKGSYLHKNALNNRSTKNGQKITKYFRIVNKAHNIESSATRKIINIRTAASPKAPKIVADDVIDGYVKVRITDYSTNEKSFNLYYVDIEGKKTLYTTVNSQDTKGTGDVTSIKVYWLSKGDFHGFVATAVDKYGLEGKVSNRAVVTGTDDEEYYE